MVASPRRSHRSGNPKSKKIVEDDDGGQTRCVCNQQHHEGVMIQCETCKVWQHCPCVGLGDGEVTPDKYYCDACRPENHPYRVQDGQLISNIKNATPQVSSISTTGTKAKSSKKRSTMNSKDAAFFMDHTAEYSSKDDHNHLLPVNNTGVQTNNDSENLINGHHRTSKRRKRMDSNVDPNDNPNTLRNANGQAGDQKSGHTAAAEKDVEMQASVTSSSPKTTQGKNKTQARTVKPKKTIKLSSTQSPPNSPGVIEEEEAMHGQDGQNGMESIQSTSLPTQLTRRVSGKKGARTVPEGSIGSTSHVKRKKSIKSDTPQLDEQSHSSDQEEPDFDQNESAQDTTDATTDFKPSSNNHRSQGDNSNLLHPTIKRPSSQKGHLGDSDTPTPSGTPQPMQPAPPTKVKYPSPRMTFKDMNKRAQQLLEYISRVQVEMTELQNKAKHDILKEMACVPQAKSSGLTVDTAMQALKPGSSDTESRWLSTPPQSVHELGHGDGSEQILVAKSLFKNGVEENMVLALSTTESDFKKDKAPMTPPHQPTIDCGVAELMEVDSVVSLNDHSQYESSTRPTMVTSLDLMEKLTGELISFQEKYGHFGE
ncbi:hypothetical protein BX616_002012 [Lobosporangium transversale]|nr:hypothetical protein BX616_002012 [Lobosporangium transversale]